MLTIDQIAELMKKGIFEFTHNPNHGWPAPKLLPLPSRKAMERGKIMTSLESRFPEYEFDSWESFCNPMVCEACLYTAEHFLCWKNGWRYQIWACGCSNWTAGPWSCPSKYLRFSSKN